METVSKLYKENKRFFFNVGDSDINSTKGIIRYLGRYFARSPIAEYKITEIDDDKVTFFFNDLANNKKKTFITMSDEKFISQILIHLPPKNFKMVNRYGFYSRHISDKLKKAMQPFKKNIVVSKYSFYQRQMYITFGMNPFFCPKCKIRMIVLESIIIFIRHLKNIINILLIQLSWMFCNTIFLITINRGDSCLL